MHEASWSEKIWNKNENNMFLLSRRFNCPFHATRYLEWATPQVCPFLKQVEYVFSFTVPLYFSRRSPRTAAIPSRHPRCSLSSISRCIGALRWPTGSWCLQGGWGRRHCALCAVRSAEGRFGFNSLMAISHKLGFPWPSGADVARGLKPSCFCGKFPWCTTVHGDDPCPMYFFT